MQIEITNNRIQQFAAQSNSNYVDNCEEYSGSIGNWRPADGENATDNGVLTEDIPERIVNTD